MLLACHVLMLRRVPDCVFCALNPPPPPPPTQRFFVLTNTDALWKEHLQAIKFLQQVSTRCAWICEAYMLEQS